MLCPRGKGYERGHEVLDGIHIYRHPMPQEGNSPFGYVREYACRVVLGICLHLVDLFCAGDSMLFKAAIRQITFS